MKFQSVLPFFPALLPLIGAAPAPRASNNPPLKGSEALIGYSPTEKLPSGPKPDIKYSLLPGQKEDPKLGTYLDFENVENPQPIRGNTGGDDPGPSKWKRLLYCTLQRAHYTMTGNLYYDKINSDKLAPPGTDNGATINAQWPMGKPISDRQYLVLQYTY